jgi:hypothetical protein
MPGSNTASESSRFFLGALTNTCVAPHPGEPARRDDSEGTDRGNVA